MSKIKDLVLITLFCFCISGTGMAQDITVVVKGLAWDSDSWGFAFYQNLSKPKAMLKAARRGARVTVEGRPDVFAITGEGVNLSLHLQRRNRLLN